MKINEFIRSILVIFSIVSLFACSDNDKESKNSTFEVTSESISLFQDKISIDVPQVGKQYVISVTASEDITWRVNTTKGENFITTSPSGDQKGNGEITITIDPNEEEMAREGTVNISNSLGKGKNINITQEKKIDKTFHFAVMGDLHYGLAEVEIKVPRALKMIMQKNPKVEALFICGDFTNNGTAEQYQKITTLINEKLPSTVKAYYMLGNHDTYEVKTSTDAYEQYTGQPFYQYIEKGGYPFITISVDPTRGGSADYHADGIKFLKDNLANAALAYKNRPIFVFSHSPSTHTPWGAKWGYNTIHEILKDYPQVIHFTGHTHYTIEDERSIWQDKYTWINVGPSNYANISTDVTPAYEYPASGKKITEAIVVDIDENTNIKVSRLDTYNEEELKTPWLIEAPHNGTRFKYSGDMQNRTDKDAAPLMNGVPQVTDITEYACNVTFDQGTDDSFIWHYKVEAVNTSKNEVEYECLVFSDFHWRNNESPTLSCPVSRLTPGTTYKIIIKGVDSFLSESTPIESEPFTTSDVPEIDPDVQAPKADLVDIVFTNTEAKNAAIATSGLTVKKQGKGTPTGYNSNLKTYVAKPSTTGAISDFYLVNYNGNTIYTNGVKDGFTFEVYCKTSDIKTMQYPFSNLQGAGMGFSFNESYTSPKGATFCAMIRGDGKYHKINFMEAADIKANTYYHLLFTWDGQQIRLYRDGKFVASDACTKLTMPSGTAQYICIGADSDYDEKATNAFNGEIALARIYSKAVDISEAASLYKQLKTREGITEFNRLNTLLTGGTLSEELATEGWKLMNNIATTKAELEAFFAKQ